VELLTGREAFEVPVEMNKVSKEPYISAKELYISKRDPKEPYISTKNHLKCLLK